MADVTTTSNTLDPWLKGVLSQSLQRAQGIADQPYQPYWGQGYAPLSTNQRYAMEQAQRLNGAGAPALDLATQGAGGVLGYSPMTISPTMAGAANINRGDIRDVSGASAVGGISDWMTPYTSSVVDASLADLAHARDMQGVKDMQAATRAGSFQGAGSRQGVAQALTNDDYLRTVASTSANLRNQGFNTAAGLAQQDAGRRFAADQANQGIDYSVASGNAGFNQQTGLFNAGAANDAAARNQGADLSGAQLRNSASGLLGQLGTQQFNNANQYVNQLSTTGAVDQATQQGQNTFDYNEFLRQLEQPYKGQQLINQSAGLLPASSTSTTTAPSQSILPGILGAGVKLLTASGSNGGSILGNWLQGF